MVKALGAGRLELTAPGADMLLLKELGIGRLEPNELGVGRLEMLMLEKPGLAAKALGERREGCWEGCEGWWRGLCTLLNEPEAKY